jgi:hypothetical protein
VIVDRLKDFPAAQCELQTDCANTSSRS